MFWLHYIFLLAIFPIKLLLLILTPNLWQWSPQTVSCATIAATHSHLASNNSISPLQWCLLSWPLSSHDVSPPQSCFIQNCHLLLPLLFVVWSGLGMSGIFWFVLIDLHEIWSWSRHLWYPCPSWAWDSLDETRSVSCSEIFHFKIVTSFFLSWFLFCLHPPFPTPASSIITKENFISISHLISHVVFTLNAACILACMGWIN